MKPGYFLLIFCSLVLAGCGQSVGQAGNPTAPPPVTLVPTLSGMPNPAAVFCEQKGYKLETVTAADGSQSANCLFLDGSKCDEWAYFRGECQPAGAAATPTPAATELAAPATPLPSPLSPALPVLRVAYWGAGQIGLWTEGVGSRRLAATNNAEVRHVRLSDDGQVVAYAADRQVMQGAYALAVVNADGSGQRVLAGEEFWTSTPPISRTIALGFAPASHTLYFTTGGNDLYRVDPAQGAPAAVFPPGQGGFFSFSPDGRWMTVYHPNELVLARPDGSNAHVAFQFPEDYRWTNAAPEIRWKPDSSGFFVASASGPVGSHDDMTLWLVPVAGQPVKQMSYTGPYGAYLSPDGRTIIYMGDRQIGVDVHVVTLDGKDSLYGTYPATVGFMGWAPDSKHFLLNLHQDFRLNVPYLCALGEQPVKLVDTDDAAPVDWVDAQRVLFSSHAVSLHLQRVGSPSMTLAEEASFYFDFAMSRP